jgi:spore coat polysaccharide biosynthesis predicted glycosyltransferase SpsG
VKSIRALFICRGATSVGLGHVMRCRTVAAEMARRADVHVVLIGEAHIGQVLLHGQVPYTVVDDDDASVGVYRDMRPDVVVFDLLSFDDTAFRAIADQPSTDLRPVKGQNPPGTQTWRYGCRTVCISPIFNRLDQVDLAFSRAASPAHVKLAARGKPLVRAGACYATTAPHCRQVSGSVYRRQLGLNPLAVGICMGGADAANNTLRVLETVRSVPAPMLFWVLLGEGYVHSYQRLIDCVNADRRHEVILAKTRDSMWRILGECSLVILAGGITNYEAAYANIPSIITLADDGRRWLLQELIDAGACHYAGAPLEAALPRVCELLARLNHRRDELLAMHRRCHGLVDGCGARRIADEILAFCAAERPTRACATARAAVSGV